MQLTSKKRIETALNYALRRELTATSSHAKGFWKALQTGIRRNRVTYLQGETTNWYD